MTQFTTNAIINNYFSDNNAMVNLTIQFASRYLTAFDEYAAGKVSIVPSELFFL
jgi:hypothetical protein